MNTEQKNGTAARIQQSARVERVLSWRKFIATLDEEDFFEIIRIYLGEVPTPYNKQDLVEELSAFLRKEENKQGILRLLTGIDLKILAAVRYIPFADTDKLASFFSPSLSKRQIEAHTDNLIQRLLIFYTEDEEKKRRHLALTPLLEEKLLDMLDIDILLPSYQGTAGAGAAADLVDGGKVAAMISYILAHLDLCKADGNLKKKNAEELTEMTGSTEQMQLVLTALRNLGIFPDAERGRKLVVDWNKAESFASLDSLSQKAYLCAANLGHLTRNSLYESAQLLIDTFNCARDKHYSKEALLRLSFLIKQKENSAWASSGRFQRLISGSAWGRQQPAAGETGGEELEAALDAAIAYGYIVKEGSDSEGEGIYYVNPLFFENEQDSDKKLSDSITIDAAFTFMVMPGLPLRSLLPLVKFLDLVKYDKVISFEINKKSVMRSFDIGLDSQKIQETISRYCAYPIPQNLEVSLDEWFGSYSSASLYKGYLLKVSGENEIRVKKNPFLSSHIIETFGPGLYLLDFTDDIMAQNAIKHCGLDFIGKIKTKEADKSAYSFYALRGNKAVLSYEGTEEGKRREAADGHKIKQEQDKLLCALKDKVAAMRIPQEQKDGLFARIDRRVIIQEEQLRPESVRFEKLEAFGMDYQGKVHVVEGAVLAKCLVEITNSDQSAPFLGEVTAFTKYEGEAEVTLKREDGTEKTFSISQAALVKKVTRPLTF